MCSISNTCSLVFVGLRRSFFLLPRPSRRLAAMLAVRPHAFWAAGIKVLVIVRY